MMKKTLYIIAILAFTACDYFKIEKKPTHTEAPIVRVYDKFLYPTDLVKLLPKISVESDSVVVARSIITNWAKNQILIKKAEENLTEEESRAYENLVKKYKNSLLINGYKERLVNQQLDTVVSEEEITDYYDNNRTNFKLSESLIKLRFLRFSKNLMHKKEIVSLFRSDKAEDLIALEDQRLNFVEMDLNDSSWVRTKDVLLKISKFTDITESNLLNNSKFIQKEDSLDLYLVAVKDVLIRNDLAPLDYMRPTIKQLILHKRKLGLIRDIEKTLLKDAIQNEDYKEY